MVVIFDPEGVLTDTAACRYGAWKQMAREQGIEYTEAWHAELRGQDEKTCLQSILSRAKRSYTPAEHMALLARAADLYDDQLTRLGEDALRPGAAQMIRRLKKHGAQLGAVMTGGMPGWVLNKLSLRAAFDVISRMEDMASQLADVQLRLNAAPNDCLLVTAYRGSAKTARGMGMQALLCGGGEDGEAIMEQILAILPDFDKNEQ